MSVAQNSINVSGTFDGGLCVLKKLRLVGEVRHFVAKRLFDFEVWRLTDRRPVDHGLRSVVVEPIAMVWMLLQMSLIAVRTGWYYSVAVFPWPLNLVPTPLTTLTPKESWRLSPFGLIQFTGSTVLFQSHNSGQTLPRKISCKEISLRMPSYLVVLH